MGSGGSRWEMDDVKCQTDLEMEGSLKAEAPTRLETDAPHSHILR